MDNPCAKRVNGKLIQCSKRSMGCAVDCPEWAVHKIQNQQRYDENALNSITDFVPNYKYINKRIKGRRKENIYDRGD